MMRVCQCLQSLCCNVYSASYGTHVDDVAFEMRPTPRIEVQTVQDLDVLLQNGLVSNENAADLSNMVLGMDLRQIMGKVLPSCSPLPSPKIFRSNLAFF